MKKGTKKVLGLTLASSLALSAFAAADGFTKQEVRAKKPEKPMNVIMLVMDGASSSATTLARWYKGKPLAMDEIATGGVRTFSSESAITDSAPAGTALATGNKSNSGYVGVLPSLVNSPGAQKVKEKDAFRPVANVLEGAELSGRATGIVATSEIQHATPAAFSSHHGNRNNFSVIAEQQVYQDMEVVLGGGKSALLPESNGGTRKDGENLISELEKENYDFVETKADLMKSRSEKIWGSFSNKALAYDMDRQTTNPDQPTLEEMTSKSLQTLSKDKDGFFLFVEGSKPDWAAHANDPIGMISDVLAFDNAVQKALNYAKKDGNTMVIALTDHGNSGLTIGNQNTNKNYDTTPVSAYIDPLKKAKMTLEGVTGVLKDDLSNMEEAAALYGITDPSSDEKAKMAAAKTKAEAGVLLPKLLANRANLGFTTGGHTGEDVFLYSYGPKKPYGMIDNTEVAEAMAKGMGFSLDKLTDELFMDASKAFKQIGATVKMDRSNANETKLIVKRGRTEAVLKADKDEMVIKGKTYELNSVIVDSNGKFYVPKQAVELLKKNS
ncbi:alkaline phosphatase [Bacillus mangrovi]|uniref:Alkaline phosphatase n=1 Tax=Metabacillus mangrovi TaxID=1491830 RepID=A0A7X2S4H2_9BACI|nr:alkaline phosphatase [Metabacillus mangrovi]MTH53081.1 alkaline phosphatase [Metabacillus mangrovi]